LYRNASTHAAGVVIGDRPLTELVPLYQDPRSDMPATQFNMKWVEPAGLVKFDFLGLKTLTVIARALTISKRGRNASRISTRCLFDDRPTYELLSRGETDRRVPAGKHGHARRRCASSSRTRLRTSSR
jgi:DNA polymerase-3 subunit alpha